MDLDPAPRSCAGGDGGGAAEALHRWARTTLAHDQDVAALVLDGQEDLGDHDEDPALGGRGDVPHALRIGRVVAGVVGGLDVARVVAELPAAVLVCGCRGPWAWSGPARSVPGQLGLPQPRRLAGLRPILACLPVALPTRQPGPEPVFPGGPLPNPHPELEGRSPFVLAT